MSKTIRDMLDAMLDMTYRMGELGAGTDARLSNLAAARDKEKARLMGIINDALRERGE